MVNVWCSMQTKDTDLKPNKQTTVDLTGDEKAILIFLSKTLNSLQYTIKYLHKCAYC